MCECTPGHTGHVRDMTRGHARVSGDQFGGVYKRVVETRAGSCRKLCSSHSVVFSSHRLNLSPFTKDLSEISVRL